MIAQRMSHPTRVRGLKHIAKPMRCIRNWVAPHAGAWIETIVERHNATRRNVAPHAGAWIETSQMM